MEFMQKNALYKAIMLAVTTTLLVACGADDGSNGVSGVSGDDGLSGTNGANGANGINGINGTDGKNAYLPRVEFSGVELPTSDADKRTIQSTTTVTIDGVAQTIGFTKLIATGEVNNGETFGLSKDSSGVAIQFEDASNLHL